MTTIGSMTTSTQKLDRAAYVQRIVDTSKGEFTTEEVTARLEESDRMKLKAAQSTEAFLKGEGTYIGTSVGNKVIWAPKRRDQALAEARQARTDHYKISGHHYNIEALNVDSAVRAQGTLTGGDLKNLSYYADYLRNEVSAATEAKANFSFTGAWGKNVTNDVGEYVSWLFQAAQLKSQGATGEQSA